MLVIEEKERKGGRRRGEPCAAYFLRSCAHCSASSAVAALRVNSVSFALSTTCLSSSSVEEIFRI